MAKVEDSMLGLGVFSMFGGYMAASCLPDYKSAACGFIVLGAGCVVDYISHRSVFDRIFKSLKLGVGTAYPFLNRKEKKEGYTLYEFTLPAGLSSDKFIEHQTEIEQYLGRSIQINYGFKNLLIKVFPLNEKTYYRYESIPLKGGMPIFIGYDRTGSPISIDLANGEPHMYIGGETGSGKSTALRGIITNLILNNDVDLYLGDLKNGVEFNLFRNSSKVISFARTDEEIIQMLTQVEKEVDRRYKLFAEADVENIKNYNKHSKKLKYQLVVIDEFATLMYNKTSQRIIEGLAAKSRACGIHLLIATQRPSANVINGNIKANFGTVLGLKTLDGINSQIIIGHTGLDKLRGKGHGILRRGSDETVIQAPDISVEMAKELIAPFNVEKKQQKPVDTKPKPKLCGFDFMERL